MSKKKTTHSKPSKAGDGPARGKLATVSTNALQAELRKRERRLKVLRERREGLVAKLEALDVEIAEYERSLGLPTSNRRTTPRRKRPRNRMNLVAALQLALKKTTMSVTEVAEAVQSNGYITTSPNFRTIVNQALISHPDKFRKVARGRYTAR